MFYYHTSAITIEFNPHMYIRSVTCRTERSKRDDMLGHCVVIKERIQRMGVGANLICYPSYWNYGQVNIQSFISCAPN